MYVLIYIYIYIYTYIHIDVCTGRLGTVQEENNKLLRYKNHTRSWSLLGIHCDLALIVFGSCLWDALMLLGDMQERFGSSIQNALLVCAVITHILIC